MVAAIRPDPEPPARLVEEARAGDLGAFGKLVARFQGPARGYAGLLLGDAALAEDVAQEAFLEAHARLGSLRNSDAFPGWLRLLVRKHADRVTRRRRLATVPLEGSLELAAPAAPPDEVAERLALRAAVRAEVTRLPERERWAVVLFYLHDQPVRDIADLLHLPVTTVKKRLHDGRRRLKERLIAMDLGEEMSPHERRFSQAVELLLAVRTNDVGRVGRLVTAAPALARDPLRFTAEEAWRHLAPSSRTALHLAARCGRTAIVRALLTNGASPDGAGGEALTPLDEAVLSDEADAAAVLLEAGADPGRRSSGSGLTPLHRAALRGYAPLVELLLRHGADPQARDLGRRTPLDWARHNGHRSVVALLAETR